MRFPILRARWVLPLLVLFGGTAGRSYLELTDDKLVARFGWLSHYTFPVADIESAGRRSWPLIGGLGWRTNFMGYLGLIGSYSNIVELRFKRRQRLWMLLPMRCDRLAVSLRDPNVFLDALADAGVAVH